MGVVAIDFDRHFLAELLPSGAAMVALGAALIMMHHDALADARFRGPDRGADRDHHAAGFVPGDDSALPHRHAGRPRLALGAAVMMQVAAAHAGRLHLDHDIMGIGGGIFERHQFQPTFAREYNAAHGFLRFVIIGQAEFDRKKRGWQRGVANDFLHTVIASGAKQSMARHNGKMDCFAALAMTGKYSFAVPRRSASESCQKLPPLRAWGMPGADAPVAARVVE